MRGGWRETTVEKLVHQKIIEKPLDGNHGEIHPKKSDFTESGIPFVMASDLVNGVVNQESCNFISREQANSLRKGFAKNGDVLLSHKGTIGRSAILHTSLDYVVLTPQVTYYRVLDNSLLDNRFLYYAFHSPKFQREIKKIAGTGSTRAYIGITQQLQLHIPLAPLAEQKRIVAILDEAFEGIDRAIANSQKNLANARELFESYLNTLFTQKGDGWEEKKLKEISECVSVGYVGETSSFYCDEDDGVPFLRSQNVRPGRLDLYGVRYVTKEFHAQVKKSRLLPGDLLFVRVGANRGDCCSVPNDIEELNCANIVFARPRKGLIEYLEYYCQSKIGRELLMGMTTGSAQGVINTKSVAELPIPFPPIEEQRHISDKINALAVETQRLETIYRQKIAALKELKQSILQKAFTGKLTAETPKTVKEEIAA